MSEQPEKTDVIPESKEVAKPLIPDTPQGDNGGKEGQFTQGDIDRIGTRIRHETRDVERKKILEEMGIESFDVLKSFVTDAQERKQASLSELEKATAQIEAANQKALDAEQKLSDLQAEQIAFGRGNAFKDAVRKAGSDDGDNLILLVQAKMGDMFDAVFDDGETEANEDKMDALVKEVQSKFAMFFGSSGAGSPSNNNGVARSSADMTKEAEAAYNRQLRR